MKIKDMFNQQSMAALAEAIQGVHPSFDALAFLTRVFVDAWPDLELKERMRHVTLALVKGLPPDYDTGLDIVCRALPAYERHGFAKMVFPDYVHVCGVDDWASSMAALEIITQHISAEFAIRPFIVRYPQRTLDQMLCWAHHEHPEVRRLASEGCRPRLPWGIGLPALKADPAPILPILETLKEDPADTVKRSVANNLNDIAKDNPDIVLDLLERWQPGSEQVSWITGHALRTLVKEGNPRALELLGYPREPVIAIHRLAIEPEQVPMGGEVTFSFEIESLSDEPQRLMIDYVLYLVRARGKQTPKVFKLSKKTLAPGERLALSKTHSFRPITTRRYYPGLHAIEPKVNGQLLGRVDFTLME